MMYQAPFISSKSSTSYEVDTFIISVSQETEAWEAE